MATLNRADWYDIARDTNWTPRYASVEEIFPDEMSDAFGLTVEQWEAYDEPFKISYREYVAVQSKKDADAYSVKAALARANFFDKAAPGWISILKMHYGAICLAEYIAVLGEAKMARFGKAPGMRNMATFGSLDEMRHTQIQLYFAHENIHKSRQLDWGLKTYHTQNWAGIAGRAMLDDVILGRDAATMSIMLTFALEQGFTNLQFLGLAADAAKMGDYSFSNLISSVQTDEARHAQIGTAALKVLIANGKKAQAQQAVEIAFWRNWRLFFSLTGPAIDYLTPLEHRHQSFKEFVHEFIVAQFERAIEDLGLDRPWYWDFFLDTTNYYQHSGHLELWFLRQTLWWNPAGGVTPAERAWLEEKYPGWNQRWGRLWDVIADNVQHGRQDKLFPATVPMLCNICGLSIGGIPGQGHHVKGHWTDYGERRYYFCSAPCKWIFDIEQQRYAGHKSIVDRLLAGDIQPGTIDGTLEYMGLFPGERGDDADDYAWARSALPPMNDRSAGHADAAAGL
ncbi:MAG: YHS domain-containing protein [Nevskia sp.]|nr:YHS domain-containing protein [Nevskia sp.]